jgi:hypothetical protein
MAATALAAGPDGSDFSTTLRVSRPRRSVRIAKRGLLINSVGLSVRRETHVIRPGRYL